MNTDCYIGKKKALERLGISGMTLLKLEELHKIETIKTIGGHRKYNVEKYIRDNKSKVIVNNIPTVNVIKENICYVRVSTTGQKDDLGRQKEYMINKYPTYRVIEDIGSGINFNRRGLREIIKLGIAGKINIVVVAYKDRLTRFGYELIEDLIKEYSNGKIIIENNKEEHKEPKEELVEDVMQILNVYTAKMNGLRKYKKL